MYVNKFMRKEASFDFLKTIKDTWNSLSPEHREAIRNAGIGFATGSVGNLLLGDSERTASQKALDALLWGTGTGAAFYGAGRGYRYLKKYLQDRQKERDGMLRNTKMFIHDAQEQVPTTEQYGFGPGSKEGNDSIYRPDNE